LVLAFWTRLGLVEGGVFCFVERHGRGLPHLAYVQGSRYFVAGGVYAQFLTKVERKEDGRPLRGLTGAERFLQRCEVSSIDGLPWEGT
jgi:hypothetical protein